MCKQKMEVGSKGQVEAGDKRDKKREPHNTKPKGLEKMAYKSRPSF